MSRLDPRWFTDRTRGIVGRSPASRAMVQHPLVLRICNAALGKQLLHLSEDERPPRTRPVGFPMRRASGDLHRAWQHTTALPRRLAVGVELGCQGRGGYQHDVGAGRLHRLTMWACCSAFNLLFRTQHTKHPPSMPRLCDSRVCASLYNPSL